MLFTIAAMAGGIDASQVAVLDLAAGTWKTVIRGGSQAQYVPSGHLVYVAGGALWAIGFDLARLETTGTAVPVVSDVVTLPNGTAEFDVARDGTLVYAAGGAEAAPRTLVWVDRYGREEALAAPARAYVAASLSPDGTRVALEVEDQNHDVWVWDLPRQTLTRVTTDPGSDQSPVWTPDGRRLVFSSQVGGGLGSLFWQAADGTGSAERLTASSYVQRPSAVVADGTRVLFTEGADVMMLTLDSRPTRAASGRYHAGRATRRDLARRSMGGVPLERLGAVPGVRATAAKRDRGEDAGINERRLVSALGQERSGTFLSGARWCAHERLGGAGRGMESRNADQGHRERLLSRSRCQRLSGVRRLAGRPAVPHAQASRQPGAVSGAGQNRRRPELGGGVEASRSAPPLRAEYIPEALFYAAWRAKEVEVALDTREAAT